MGSDYSRSRTEYEGAEQELARIEAFLDSFSDDDPLDVLVRVRDARKVLEQARGLLYRGTQVVSRIRRERDPHYAEPTSARDSLDPAQPGVVVRVMCHLHQMLMEVRDEQLAPSSQLKRYARSSDWSPPSIQSDPPLLPKVLGRERVISRLLDQAQRTSDHNAEKGKRGAEKAWRHRKVDTELRTRGLACVLREEPDITASQLLSWLDGSPRPYDEDDIQLSWTGGDVVVEDLSTGQVTTFPADQLSTHLRRARRR